VDGANSLAELLKLRENDARSIYDGVDALRVAQEFQPEIILLDIGLPGKTGYEVVGELKREWRDGDAIIIAVSGYGSPEHRRRSAEAGFDAHFVKPIAIADLQAFIASRAESKAPG
jgi:DNA-binding response OmpR family regulator